MTNLKILLGAFALLCSTLCLGQFIITTADGGSLVPGPGDADGVALAGAWILDGEIHFAILVEDVVLPLTGVHIQQGAEGVNGSAVLNLSAYIDGDAFSGTAAIDPTLATDILANPAGFYLVIRNDDFPAGAVRGQFQAQSTSPLSAVLLAENEVPPLPPGPNGVSELQLGGFIIAHDDSAEALEIPPTGHHIHAGPAGVNGQAMVFFDSDAWSGDATAASARGIAIAEPQLVLDILADPAAYYINVHTETFPAGAIRGQLGGEVTATSIAVPINASWALALIILALASFGLISVRERRSRSY